MKVTVSEGNVVIGVYGEEAMKSMMKLQKFDLGPGGR